MLESSGPVSPCRIPRKGVSAASRPEGKEVKAGVLFPQTSMEGPPRDHRPFTPQSAKSQKTPSEFVAHGSRI